MLVAVYGGRALTQLSNSSVFEKDTVAIYSYIPVQSDSSRRIQYCKNGGGGTLIIVLVQVGDCTCTVLVLAQTY